MNTPKIKAKELVREMLQHISTHLPEPQRWERAKNCALVAVKQVITELNKLSSKDLSDLQFWGEVEIEVKQIR